MKSVLGMLLAWMLLSEGLAQQTFDLERAKPVIEQAIRAELAKGTSSVSIALVQGDRIIWTAAYGYANATTRTPATPLTVYSTGSTGKSITATAIMQLVEQGKINLDAPVNQYLTTTRVMDRVQVLQADEPVTVRQLLSHTSGLSCGVRTVPVFSRTLPPDLAALTGRTHSVRKPEEKYEYCNAAYGIAGYLVEQVSGQEYEKYIVENILKPIGVETPAPVRPTALMADLLAQPYSRGDGNKPSPVARVFFDVYPAGDMYMTPADMARYLGAHLNGGVFGGRRILSEASILEMHKDQSPTIQESYGFGFMVSTAPNGNTIITHGGSVPGLNAHLIGDLNARAGVYVMSNSGGVSNIGRVALELLRGAPLQPER